MCVYIIYVYAMHVCVCVCMCQCVLCLWGVGGGWGGGHDGCQTGTLSRKKSCLRGQQKYLSSSMIFLDYFMVNREVVVVPSACLAVDFSVQAPLCSESMPFLH